MVRVSLLTKLLLAILIPTVISFAGFAVLGHFAAARALEAELGRRLAGIAAVAATQLSEESVALLAPGDEESRTYRNLRRRLTEMRDAAGVARIYLFAADLTARVDTDEVPIGARYYGLESSRAELRQVFPATAEAPPARPASSLLFRGHDGKLYKSGYAPLGTKRLDEKPAQTGTSRAETVRFAVGVDGSAALYADLLGLRKTLLFVGSGGVLSLVLLAVLFGLGLTRPLRRLLDSARLMGSGVFDQQVAVVLPPSARPLRIYDEVAELGQGLEAMRQALRARDERMQMMLAGIAHEVRNPLGGIELFAGLLTEELEAAAQAPETQRTLDVHGLIGYVARIKKELWHLQAVVSEFLEYARRTRPVLSRIAVADLFFEVRDSVSSRQKDVRIAVELPKSPLFMAADATQLRRVLLNLVHNAVQACQTLSPEDPRARTVTLSARLRPNDKIELAVRDSGPGIPDDILPQIWTPFFTTRAQGTGLGLAFVREIIRDHGGEIAVDTGATGTCFALTLPASPAPQ